MVGVVVIVVSLLPLKAAWKSAKYGGKRVHCYRSSCMGGSCRRVWGFRDVTPYSSTVYSQVQYSAFGHTLRMYTCTGITFNP